MATRKTKKTTSTKELMKKLRAQEASRPKLKAIAMPRLSVAIKRQPASTLPQGRALQQAQFHKAMRAFFGL